MSIPAGVYINGLHSRHRLAGLCLLGLSALGLAGCASRPPKADDCGRLSEYLVPPVSEQLYRALVTHINGKPVISQPNYILAPGHYELTMVELIHAPGMEAPLTARKTKTLAVNLKAGEQLHLAAKYYADQRNEGFWEPVVWQTDKAQCRMSKAD
ncbi:MAG: hypothetical protein LPD71_08950 [Shewanella sp.]|nr:hypothetical protein [Shewanella sp.]MCF1429484.1 hypothetical protein [Shewanella sp.]MCF1438855.1 hypothetical protein [Shewanella sp.]MCF1457832.1 hypothetical protein [Shewanella sp.]